MRVRWLDEARWEASESVRYYAEIEPELGAAFLDELESQLALAKALRDSGSPLHTSGPTTLRRHLLHRFEYALVIAVAPDELVVVALHHQRRRPNYWRERLEALRSIDPG